MKSIELLLELAETALASHESLDQEIEAVSAYTEKFSSWQARGIPEDASLKSALKRLHSRHVLILKKAARLQDETRQSLGALRRKTRGLKRYLDVFPVPARRPRSRKG